ncbi:hypothetical protein [uncultured Algibacter sp.]|uniref:hypothetical protein n=1 Tax=uncultured Algibacter sp. TaxID=298659 RepID=UPI00263749DC|nr:hypothetical protein [uncultured Algibacter sp.]
MKTIMMTLAAGIFVLLLTSAGVKRDTKLLNESASKSEKLYAKHIDDFFEYNNLEKIKDPYGNEILRVRDIEVFEMEEDVELGFDARAYLPMDFNPVKGLEPKEQLEYEEKVMFGEVFGEIINQRTLRIEDIELYEVEN